MHPKIGLFYFSGNAFVNKDGKATVVFGGTDSPAISAAVALVEDLNKWKIVSSKNGTPKQNPNVTDQEAPFELKAGELLQLRIFID